MWLSSLWPPFLREIRLLEEITELQPNLKIGESPDDGVRQDCSRSREPRLVRSKLGRFSEKQTVKRGGLILWVVSRACELLRGLHLLEGLVFVCFITPTFYAFKGLNWWNDPMVNMCL